MAYKKRFWIVLIASIGIPVLVLLAGMYRFNFTNADIYMELADGEVVQYDDLMREIEEKGYSKVMLSLFSIRTKEDLNIKLPGQPTEESPIWVPLRAIDSQATHRSAVGDYTAGEEQGIIALSYDTIRTLIPEADNQKIMFIAPFSVSNQGTRVFYYLGLFEQDNELLTVHHKDSVLLGDRINIINVEADNQGRSVAIEYTERESGNESQETTPPPPDAVVIRVVFTLTKDPARFSTEPEITKSLIIEP